MKQKLAKTTQEVPTWNSSVLFAVRALALGAMIVAAYLAWVSFGGRALIGCGPVSNCREVLYSRWAYWLGLPVSALAVLAYGLMFVGTFRLSRSGTGNGERKAYFFVIPCCFAVIGAAVWFVLVQLFVVGRVCPLCMTAHLLAVSASATLICSAPVRRIFDFRTQKSNRQPVTTSEAGKLLSAGLGVVAVLILGQLFHQPKRYAAESAGTMPAVKLTTPHGTRLQVFGGEFQLDLHNVPLIGSPEAPQFVVGLFDYTCYACRVTHGYLLDAQKSSSNQFTMVTLPAPLDGTCNPTITNVYPAHSNACQYARLALAVWQANPSLFEQFDSWLFGRSLPPFIEARAYAERLLGKELSEKALRSEVVDGLLKQGLAIYARNHAKFGRESMPQVIIGTNIIFGSFNKKESFQQLFDKALSGPN